MPGAPRSAENPPLHLEARDEVTGSAAPVPPGITAGTDNPVRMSYADGTLIWDSTTGQLRGWRAEWGRSVTLVPGLADNWRLGEALALSGAAYPRIYEQFVVWQPGETYVLDLKTNSLARLIGQAGGEDLTGSMLAMEWIVGPKPPFNDEHVPYDESVIDLAKMPDLPGCP